MKSRTVLLGHPARRNALAMLQRLSWMTWRTFTYRLWMLERLWEFTRPISASDRCCGVCCSGSWWSLRLRSDWTAAFRSAINFLACSSLLSAFLITSSFVLTRLASSCKSASRSAKSLASSLFWSFRFWNADLTSLCSFCKLSYSLRRSATLCWSPDQRTVSAFSTSFFYLEAAPNSNTYDCLRGRRHTYFRNEK